MPPKRAKSGGSAGVSRWETGLLTTAFEEDTWKANIALVVSNQLDDNIYTDILSTTIASGLRRLFSVISKDQLYEEVKELGNPKAKKPKETPQFFEICEVVKKHLDEEEDIPLPLLGKLLKWKLLDIKAKDFKRREDEKKAAEGKGKGKDGKGGKDKRPRSKSPTKGKGKKTPEPPAPKQGTKLKKRGEEDEENKYIDDEPDDGPQHYVIITGFPQAQLLSILADLGVVINCIIKMESEDYSRFDQNEEEETTLAEGEIKEEDELQKAKIEKAKEELSKFWEMHELLLRKAAVNSKLHDVARLSYSVKESIIPTNLEDNEKRVRTAFGTVLFEDVACQMYDLLDWKRQYHTYLYNMNLINVPIATGIPAVAPTGVTFGQGAGHKTVSEAPSGMSAPVPGTTTAPTTVGVPTIVPTDISSLPPPETDMRYYNHLMNSVPHESMSVPLIVNCMLEQIVATEEDKEIPSDIPKLPREDGLDHILAKHVSCVATKLGLNREDQQSLCQELNTPEKQCKTDGNKPYLYHFGDDIGSRLHHLKTIHGFSPLEAEYQLLDYTPSAILKEFTKPSSITVKERASRLQELVQFCASGVLSQSEINRAFKQFVFESLELKSTDEFGQLIHGNMDELIPWDDPYPYFKNLRRLRSAEASCSESVSSGKLLEAILEQDIDTLKDGVKSQVAASPDKPNQSSPASSAPGSRPGTGILRNSRGSRQGSAASAKSVKSSVHFEKDEMGNVHIHSNEEFTINEETGSCTKKQRPQSAASSTISFSDINESQLRNLDDWSYAEYFEPKVLLQVLENARSLYPYMDTYYHKRDHSLLVIMHNPIGPDLKTYEPWDTQLHSDVGFRNYLEHVAESIADWVRREEDKYQAALKEAELAAAAATPPPTDAGDSRPSSSKSRPRSLSPKKDGKKSASPSRSLENLDPNSGNFMRPNSLKAWKEEQDKIKEEEEQKRIAKEAKKSRSRSTSPKKKDEKDGKGKEKEKERSSSRTSSRGNKEEKEKEKDKAQESKSLESVPEITEPQEQKKIYPFTGYNVGNDLIHASGIMSTMFPSDGGQIRTEKTEFIQGPVFVKSSVLKDGHTFVLHILEPKEDAIDEWKEICEDEEPDSGREKADDEKSEKEVKEKQGSLHESISSPLTVDDVSITTEDSNKKETPTNTDVPKLSIDVASVKDEDEGSKKEEKKKNKPISSFGCFTATMNDGMVLSLSNYGNQGKTSEEEKACDTLQPPAPTPTPQPPPSPSGKGRASSGKKGKKQQQQQQQQLELEKQQAEQEKQQEEDTSKEEPTLNEPEEEMFQQLNISCPDGLVVRYFTDSTMGKKKASEECDGGVLVRQHYPYKSDGKHECESSRKPAMQELSRVINSDGTVIKVMHDGSIWVLFADGTVSYNAGNGPITECQGRPSSRDGSPNRLGSAVSIQGSETHTKKSALKGAPSKLSQPSIVEKDTASTSGGDTDKVGEWITTTQTGERIATKSDGSQANVQSYMSYTATDQMTNEVVMTREDRVVVVERSDGVRIVNHNEGTRITTFYQEEEKQTPEDETGEQFATRIKRVQYVKVECAGFATVVFSRETGMATTIFGNGSSLLTNPDGVYKFLHADGGEMSVEKDGAIVYAPKPNNDIIDLKPSIYVMRHNHPTLVDMMDADGNSFTVRATGKTEVNKAFNLDDLYAEEEGSENKEKAPKIETYSQYAPRFFVINEDGSGSELLRHSDIAEYLTAADKDPATAILKDSLPDYPGVTGITILKPCESGGASQKWLNSFDENNVIPSNLRSRDFKTMPAHEMNDPGPAFGTTVGKGLAVGSARKPYERGPLLECPQILQLRQLIKYKPISGELRQRMQAGLKAYATNAMKRQQDAEGLAVQDPRSESEKVQATDLELQAAVEAKMAKEPPIQADGEITGDPRSGRYVFKPDVPMETKGPVISGDPREGKYVFTQPKEPESEIGGDPRSGRYVFQQENVVIETQGDPRGGRCDAQQQDERSGQWDYKPRDLMQSDDIKAIYEAATAPPRIPTPPPPKPRRTQADWEKDRQQLEEEKKNRNALKNYAVPPYFESEWGKSFLMMKVSSDMDRLTKELAVQTRKGEPLDNKQYDASTTTESPPQASESSQPSDVDSTSPQKNSPSPLPQGVATTGLTPDLRPTNPTPAKAKGQGSPTPVRPTNPTPGRASNPGTVRPGHPTPSAMEMIGGGYSRIPSETPSSYTSLPNYPPSTIPEQTEPDTQRSEESEKPEGNVVPSAQSDIVLTRSLTTNVIGEPRSQQVRLPAAILGSKPGALLNQRFYELEDPVRRKVKTSSVAGGAPHVPSMRGFEIFPQEVDFGTVKEGCTYAVNVHLKNVGIDSCRYKIKQAPPSTGLRVIYKPAPVAAGMKAVLELELYAIAVGVEGGNGQGSIGHHLEIITETDLLYLPVSATILTANDYDDRCHNGQPPKLGPGVRILSTRPPSREGIIRPRKDPPYHKIETADSVTS
uniref:Sperm-associated antigen 17-like isoform X3 n=1 Tax=Saccoglossus kowalevskii TaxID=10224 RepID=A0ABM0MZJ2_SACKO|nr:PREDICTED: sperm-associated antigen 17-like isoform X3 [Saccoglossus kowalevskii]